MARGAAVSTAAGSGCEAAAFAWYRHSGPLHEGRRPRWRSVRPSRFCSTLDEWRDLQASASLGARLALGCMPKGNSKPLGKGGRFCDNAGASWSWRIAGRTAATVPRPALVSMRVRRAVRIADGSALYCQPIALLNGAARRCVSRLNRRLVQVQFVAVIGPLLPRTLSHSGSCMVVRAMTAPCRSVQVSFATTVTA